MFWEIRGRQNEENSLLNVAIKIQMMSPHGFQALNEVLEFRDQKMMKMCYFTEFSQMNPET